jgi:serine protease inhibitor
MKTICVVLGLIIASTILSCEKTNQKKDEFKPVVLSEKQKMVVASSNEFGFEFFKRAVAVSDNSVNMMVSPLSISMALGMMRNGSANATLDSMNRTLFVSGLSEAEINEAYKSIIETFRSLDPNVKMQIANSIWNRQGFTVSSDFLNSNKNYFDAEITSLDFSNPESVNTINTWVDDKTNHLIKKIVDQIPDEAVMYLINAIYFKGQWKYQFEPKDTKELDFLINGTNVKVPTMRQKTNLRYFKGENFEAVEMPYNQGNFNCTVLLPEAGKTINDIAPAMTLANWTSWVDQFMEYEVTLEIPKFKYEYEEKNVKPVLADMGMGIAFDDNLADFSRINPDYQLFISDIKHKTFIETNEEGTEAAAVTSVEVGTTSINPDEPQPVLLQVNRPFIYLITEKSSQTILFIGVVNDPTR